MCPWTQPPYWLGNQNLQGPFDGMRQAEPQQNNEFQVADMPAFLLHKAHVMACVQDTMKFTPVYRPSLQLSHVLILADHLKLKYYCLYYLQLSLSAAFTQTVCLSCLDVTVSSHLESERNLANGKLCHV